MKKHIFKMLGALLIALATFLPISAHSGLVGLESNGITIPGAKKIRVLLEEHSLAQETKFIIKSSKNFVLESPAQSKTTAVYQQKALHIQCKNSKLYMRCRDHTYRRIKHSSIEIASPDEKITFNGKTYQGNLTLRIDEPNGLVLVINSLKLDDYVYSVVRNESIPSWPLGMQKIQAIISRTYAVFLMQKAKLKNRHQDLYDIKNTNLHQVYNGSHNYTHLRQAVSETQDLILTHKGNVALTMFDICCGGSQPSLMRHRDVSKPYLCRSKLCVSCIGAPSYRWKEDLFATSFLEKLRSNPKFKHKFKKFGKTLADIKITDVDKSGVVHKVKLYDKKNNVVTLIGNEIRGTFLHKIKSCQFTIKKVRDRIIVAGRGYGHQQGLCQWGAKNMVQQGRSTKAILSFYYPTTTLSRLL